MFKNTILSIMIFSGFSVSGKVSLATSHELNPIDISSFKEAVSRGPATVVAFHSPSCGSCQIQRPILDSLLKTKEFSTFQSYILDFKTHKELRKSLKVVAPSTILVYKNGQEVARLMGETDKTEIQSALSKAI